MDHLLWTQVSQWLTCFKRKEAVKVYTEHFDSGGAEMHPLLRNAWTSNALPVEPFRTTGFTSTTSLDDFEFLEGSLEYSVAEQPGSHPFDMVDLGLDWGFNVDCNGMDLSRGSTDIMSNSAAFNHDVAVDMLTEPLQGPSPGDYLDYRLPIPSPSPPPTPSSPAPIDQKGGKCTVNNKAGPSWSYELVPDKEVGCSVNEENILSPGTRRDRRPSTQHLLALEESLTRSTGNGEPKSECRAINSRSKGVWATSLDDFGFLEGWALEYSVTEQPGSHPFDMVDLGLDWGFNVDCNGMDLSRGSTDIMSNSAAFNHDVAVDMLTEPLQGPSPGDYLDYRLPIPSPSPPPTPSSPAPIDQKGGKCTVNNKAGPSWSYELVPDKEVGCSVNEENILSPGTRRDRRPSAHCRLALEKSLTRSTGNGKPKSRCGASKAKSRGVIMTKREDSLPWAKRRETL
ncbi:hypothetical protein VNI00_014743 [Paramarasmius palmivorus]|uniref:Uncharacterized protein n=1 Tax=Paramarasmius palmivorus TaxID=297713 RepID=A0AAW0BQ60_9AGAR